MKRNLENMKYFRYKRVMNFKQKLFNKIQRKWFCLQILKAFLAEKSSRTQAVVFYSLLNLKIRSTLHLQILTRIQK